MSVPRFEVFLRPLLIASAVKPLPNLRAVRSEIAEQLGLTAADMEEPLRSGRQTRFQNRLSWAKVYLARAGLLTQGNPFQLTDAGREFLATTEGPVTRRQLEALPTWRDRIAPHLDAEPTSAAALEVDSHLTPEDRIDEATREIENALKSELLGRIHAEPPAFFERFIRDLMLKMDYGGGIRDRGFLTGRTGDGGIDGLIHEDALGLDAVYLQAKRYQPGSNVSAEQIRGFVGAMTGENASKGVFVTTSAFTRDAVAFVERVTQRIVLIDGDRLTDLALKHGVGVRTQRTIAIQRIDEDYFVGED